MAADSERSTSLSWFGSTSRTSPKTCRWVPQVDHQDTSLQLKGGGSSIATGCLRKAGSKRSQS
jgi:hypothetical protein